MNYFVPGPTTDDGLFLHSFPFGCKAFGGEFADQLPILQATFDRDRLVLFEVEHKTQLAIGPLAIADRSRSGMIGISRARDFVAIEFENERGRRGSVVWHNERNIPFTRNRIAGVLPTGFPLVRRP